MARYFYSKSRSIALTMVAFLAVLTNAFGQQDLELAEYYFSQGQFEQARLYYEQIYKTNKTQAVYSNYLNTLIALNEFEEAEKMVKKKLKTDSSDGVGYFQLGDLYARFGKKEDAKEQFDEALEKLVPSRANVVKLANEFSRINEFDYALKVYEKGKSSGMDDYSYSYEMATLHGNMGDFDSMVESYLDLIQESPNYIQTVQNSLNRVLNPVENAENQEMLRVKLLKRVQRSPDEPIYTELLAWLFIQKKDFSSALIQTIALDKRYSELGVRVMNLGQLAFNNRDFATATKAFQYVIDKGPLSDFYLAARIDLLNVLTTEQEEKPGGNLEAFVLIEQQYEQTLSEIGKNATTIGLIQELAHIKAFRLDKVSEAIELLSDALKMPGLYERSEALCKLELADVFLFSGEVWEASLLYSQVELDFKEDALGHEAKYRNARVSYYTGDFTWAQTQLDVLKASTSKLISNDAIDLSLLITDNFNMDTLTLPMEMFARADFLSYKGKYEVAQITLDSITDQFAGHSLSDDILMVKAQMNFKRAQFDEARDLYQKVVDLYAMDINADDALFKLADMYEFIYSDTEKAMMLYEKLITEYPGSLYVVDARKRFRELRGDTLPQ
ncbi:MAG: tetratricopeptide repeat protein [Flavobacteriales bacterium]|nr:tetratricopeptide repeat protein [Flavobacteriales bacterium]